MAEQTSQPPSLAAEAVPVPVETPGMDRELPSIPAGERGNAGAGLEPGTAQEVPVFQLMRRLDRPAPSQARGLAVGLTVAVEPSVEDLFVSFVDKERKGRLQWGTRIRTGG